jgi:hypothetical protein
MGSCRIQGAGSDQDMPVCVGDMLWTALCSAASKSLLQMRWCTDDVAHAVCLGAAAVLLAG